jgi:hypothetical protein
MCSMTEIDQIASNRASDSSASTGAARHRRFRIPALLAILPVRPTSDGSGFMTSITAEGFRSAIQSENSRGDETSRHARAPDGTAPAAKSNSR